MPAVGPGTTIIPFLNGVKHLDVIKQRFPSVAVWGGVAHIGVTIEPPNRIVHLNDLHKFLAGPLGATAAPEPIQTLFGQLNRHKANAELRHFILRDMWDKLIFLATLAGATCVMRADIGTINAVEFGQSFID